ncbi:MAG TPA: c-type cytochrome [Thermoanaerobaculia bacterium]|jgi:mono/diheme cytochrome c family protein
MKRTRIASALVFSSLLVFGVSVYATEDHPSALFKEYCAVCHGEDGKGKTPKGKQLNARDFTDEEFQEDETDSEMIEVVTEGEMDMPAFGKKLTREQIESLVKKDVRGFKGK